jgi:hypothetical protein
VPACVIAWPAVEWPAVAWFEWFDAFAPAPGASAAVTRGAAVSLVAVRGGFVGAAFGGGGATGAGRAMITVEAPVARPALAVAPAVFAFAFSVWRRA